MDDLEFSGEEPTILGMAKVREGVVLTGLSGRAGNAVFANTPFGTVLRDRPIANDPNTQKQQSARMRLARAGQTWKSLTLAQAKAWRDYAMLEAGNKPDARAAPQLTFNRLAIKMLQMSPSAVVPTVPPESLFPGDAVRFTLSASSGVIYVTPDRANAPGVVTEVLIQPLESVHRRTYLERYRTAGFWSVVVGSPVALPTRPGAYAIATRFVYAATGQSTSVLECGLIVVG